MSMSTPFTRRSRNVIAAATVAALMLAAAGTAQAADDSLGPLTPLGSTFEVGLDLGSPTFLDILDFSLSTDVTASFVASGQGFTIPGLLTLAGSPDVTFAVYKGGAAVTGWGTSFTGLSLLAGADYAFKVKGTPGGYTVTWATTPVPEPESIGLALAGIALAASLTRRRRPSH
ncbi:MAG: PEP-CTERM sorting domain-containing protein [Aquabacterium sp.]